jgi:DNA topoisomerase-1
MKTNRDIKLSKKQLRAVTKDAVKSAGVISLVYVSDKEDGIERIRKGKSFQYLIGKKKVTDKNDLARIRQLVLPPAWENVWICAHANGHLQATGLDVKKRKQYRYHALWSQFRNQTKFFNLIDFGKTLPRVRERLDADLSLPGLPQDKVLAAVVMLMQETNIRVGNSLYEKLYGSFGLTTMKDKHVQINGSTVKFSFKGKKGVYHEIDMKSRKLAKIVKQCRDIPGKELFQYYNEDGQHCSIDSGMVNEYIKKISEGEFTAKDFRTWMGTVHAIQVLKEAGYCETETETKKKVQEALDTVAKKLGNTRTVCKKYYVHPVVIELYCSKSLDKYFDDSEKHKVQGLEKEECVLLAILERCDYGIRTAV